MSVVREILLDRRSEIGVKITPLVSDIARLREALSRKQDELSALNAELDQINSAIRALEETEARSQLTIKQAVLQVLDDRPEGMTALEILAEINTRFFAGRIVRTSLSPQLSRLKDNDRKIDLRGDKWFRLPKQPTLPLVPRRGL